MFKYSYITLIFVIMVTSSVGRRQLNPRWSQNSADFATNLYQASIVGRDNENLIFSPYSIRTALGLIYMGSNGVTSNEMANGLRLQSTRKADVGRHLLGVQNYNTDISIANKVYVQEGHKLKHEFKEIARNQFNSEIENLNFTQSQQSAAIINNWVEKKTDHRIKDLISEDILDSNTAIVAVNAIHFHGEWMNTFPKSETSTSYFYINETEGRRTEMMSVRLTIPTQYSDVLKANAIKLPYNSRGLYMMIILPDGTDGLQHLERNLHQVNLMDFANSMEDVEFDEISIPKFKINFSVKLNDILKQMGMATMFSDEADFSGILETDQSMKISNVIHKAFIEVNEEGTIAGAASGGVTRLLGGRYIFTANHPFFYAIMNENGVLFIGRFVKPE